MQKSWRTFGPPWGIEMSNTCCTRGLMTSIPSPAVVDGPTKRGEEARGPGMVGPGGQPETRNETFWVWKGRNPYPRGISHKSLTDLDPGYCLSLCEFGKAMTAPILYVLSNSRDLGESVPLSLCSLSGFSFWSWCLLSLSLILSGLGILYSCIFWKSSCRAALIQTFLCWLPQVSPRGSAFWCTHSAAEDKRPTEQLGSVPDRGSVP